MSKETPTLYNLEHAEESGLNQAEIIRGLYALWKAVRGIAHNLDHESGLGSDFMSKIGTNLDTAFAKLKTPTGSTTP